MKLYSYLCVQLILTSVYLAFRTLSKEIDNKNLSDYEFKSLGVLGVILLIRMVRVESWLGFFVFAIKIAHVIMAGIMFMFDIKWAIPFTLAAIIVHFGIDPPFFEVTGRVATLQEHLLRPYIATVPECYVLFYTTWEDRCVSVTPVFIQIAEKYSAKNRLFARFDIGKSPKAQEEFKISSTNGTLRQIPTIIHFKDGKEINRLNPNIAGDKLLNLPTIVRHFKLRLPTKEEKFK